MDHDRIEGGERRWRTIRMVGDVLLLLVAQTVRFENEEFEDDESSPEETEIITIISARRADRKERRRYEKERQKSRDW
jgi:uncharacterized DUF497 family protein